VTKELSDSRHRDNPTIEKREASKESHVPRGKRFYILIMDSTQENQDPSLEGTSVEKPRKQPMLFREERRRAGRQSERLTTLFQGNRKEPPRRQGGETALASLSMPGGTCQNRTKGKEGRCLRFLN